MPTWIRLAGRRGLISCSVPKAEQLPVELRERSGVGAIQNHLQHVWKSSVSPYGHLVGASRMEA
jgi:hypothetical protein